MPACLNRTVGVPGSTHASARPVRAAVIERTRSLDSRAAGTRTGQQARRVRLYRQHIAGAGI